MTEACSRNYDNNEIAKIKEYNSLMENYKEALCGLIDHVNNLNVVPLKIKFQIPFIKKYINDIEYIPACNFCKGRSYSAPEIESAIQTPKPIPYEKYTNLPIEIL